jgi:hypothetical protein
LFFKGKGNNSADHRYIVLIIRRERERKKKLALQTADTYMYGSENPLIFYWPVRGSKWEYMCRDCLNEESRESRSKVV